jgi:hypothetical protein
MKLYTKRQNFYRRSNIITDDSGNISAVRRFIVALVILVILLLFNGNNKALAQYSPAVVTVGIFELRFYSGSSQDPNYVPNDNDNGDNFSVLPWSSEQIDIVVKGMQYWEGLIDTSHVESGNKIVINIVHNTFSDPRYLAAAKGINIIDIINNNAKPSANQTDAKILYNSLRNDSVSLSTTIHELGHVLGISQENMEPYLVDIYGEKWSDTTSISITGSGSGSDSNNVFDLYEDAGKENFKWPMFLGKPSGAIEELIGSVHNLDGSLDKSKLDILAQSAIQGTNGVGELDLSHAGNMQSLMSYGAFRGGMPFVPEIELAILEELGYSVNRRKAFGHSYYKRSDNKYDGQVIGVGYDSDYIFGVGAHVFMDQLNLLQSADISSRGEEGAGIRIDGSNNTINIAQDTNIEATGKSGVGLLAAWGSSNVLINRGNISATGEGGIGVKLSVQGGDAESYYTNNGDGIDARDAAEHYQAQQDLKGELVERFDVSGTITGKDYAIYISNTAHVKTINFMNGAEIYGNIKSDYNQKTDLTFGKKADSNGAVTNANDPNFNFVLNNELSSRNYFHIQTYGGTTTIGEYAHVDVNLIHVFENSQFNIASNYQYNSKTKVLASGFTLDANAILGINTFYNENENTPYLQVSGTAAIDNDASLDITSFKKGTYTVLKANSISGQFDNGDILVAGQTSSNRHNINLTSSNGTIKLTLDATNVDLKWKGGNGTWDYGTKIWDNNGTDEIFIDGDTVTFDKGVGTIDVPVSVDSPTMTFSSGAKYRFSGATIFADSLVINQKGTETRFNQNVETDSLIINNALLGIAANNIVKVNNATFNQATLEIGTGDDNTSAGKISVTNKAAISGGIVNVYGSQRRGIQYLFLEAKELEIDPLEGGFVLGATSDGRRGIVSYDTDLGKYWITIDGLLVDHSSNTFTHNQRNFGVYLNKLSPLVNVFNDMNDVLMIYENLSVNAPLSYRLAIDETVGNIYATAGSAGIQNTLIANRTLASYLRRPPLSEVIPCHLCQGVCQHLVGKPTSWITAIGMGATTQNDSNGHGYSQSSGGSIFGVDFMRRPSCHWGFYGSAMENVLTSKVIREHSRSHEFMAGFYFRADKSIGYWLFNNGYGFNQYKTDRTMTEFGGRKARSSHNSFNSTFYSELGTYYLDPVFRWHGYIGLQYAGIYQEAIQEREAGALNIIGDPTSTTSLRGFLGFRTERFERTFLGGMISGDFNFAWMHEYMGRTQTEFTGRFAGSPDSSLKYKVRGTDTGRDWAIFGASLGYDYGKTRFFGGYDAYLSGNQSLHSGTLGIVYVW